ncbi:AAA family ATPase [Candidatus Woesearchaeota archaeon]|nr:AAA family ATPase [Candidatus Woesearchaeota archaeon]
MIIGLTGKNAAGKGEAANYLKTKGFVYFSLSDELREEAKEKGIDAARENLIALGNDLRKKFGTGYLASKINDKISIERKEKKNDFVVDSIRNPGEINELKKNKDFLLLGIDAPVELRYARAEKRGRLGEAKTLQHFIKLEERENFNSKANQQLDRCLKMADKVVVNDSTLEEFHKKIDAALAKLKG